MVPGLGRAPVMATVPTVATATSSARCGRSCPTSGRAAFCRLGRAAGRLHVHQRGGAQQQQPGADQEPGDVQRRRRRPTAWPTWPRPRPVVRNAVPASSTSAIGRRRALDDAQERQRGGHRGRGGDHGRAQDQLLGQGRARSSGRRGRRRAAAPRPGRRARKRATSTATRGPGAQPRAVDEGQDRDDRDEVAGHGRGPSAGRPARPGRGRPATRDQRPPRPPAATGRDRTAAARRAAASSGARRHQSTAAASSPAPTTARSPTRRRAGSRAATARRRRSTGTAAASSHHRRESTPVLSACSPRVTSRAGTVPSPVRGVSPRLNGCLGRRQPQIAPCAAEPTSLAYLPSTPVV